MSKQLTWGPWRPYSGSTPYLHWWGKASRPFGRSHAAGAKKGRIVLYPSMDVPRKSPEEKPYTVVPESPIPEFARNYNFVKGFQDWMPDPEDLPEVDLETVIVGVIDTGIPLGHNRWRRPDGSTRVLAAWQQIAERDPKAPYKTPFGREFLKPEIDALLEEHSIGGLTGALDEDAFNRATGVVDFANPVGSREAARRYSHGAHVLDAAAGADPSGKDEFRDKVAILAVNLPGSAVFGESGAYLDGLIMYAAGWICQLADAIWLKNRRAKDPDWTFETDPDERIGFPTVLNISFGKQAGSKTSMDPFGKALQWYMDHRKSRRRRVLDVVMPVGNDNLSRCYAVTRTAAGREDTISLRVSPEDQSASFVEVWSELCTEFCAQDCDSAGCRNAILHLRVTPPGGKADNGKVTAKTGQVRYLKRNHTDETEEPAAAIYYDAVPGDTSNTCRIRHVLCIAPTLRQGGPGVEAPAGEWVLALENLTDRKVKAFWSVQTDQAILPGRTTARRAYFDDPKYERFDETGRVVGSYETGRKKKDRPKNLDLKAVHRGAKVRRHGTMNSTVASRNITCVAGYQASDGSPAPYSSTGRGRWDGYDDGAGPEIPERDSNLRRGPTASLPTDDGPAHFGTLAAGAANGSVVAMQGTSFASAQASRIVAQTLLKYPETAQTGNKRLFDIARADENDPTAPSPDMIDIDVGGGGRAKSRSTPRVSRTDRVSDWKEQPSNKD